MKPSYETNMFKLFIREIEIDAYTCDILSRENHEKGFNVIFKYRKDLSHMSRFFQRRQGREVCVFNVTSFHFFKEEHHLGLHSHIHFDGVSKEDDELEAIESIHVVKAHSVEDGLYPQSTRNVKR